MRGFLLGLFVGLMISVHPASPAGIVRKIITIAGTGEPGYSGDGGVGTEGEINSPYGVTVGPDGALYFCEVDNQCVRRLDLRTRRLTTVVGDRRPGYSGDRGLATDASLNQPSDVRFDHWGNLYVVEMQNHVVRRVDHVTGIITTVAGNGTAGYSGDGGLAYRAQLRHPHGILFDLHGRLLIADAGNSRIRSVDFHTGLIETFAGNGQWKTPPEGGLLPNIPLTTPRVLDLDPEGNIYVALRDANAIYRIDFKTNRIHRIAGTGDRGYAGDGGPAVNAKLNGPKGIAYASAGSLYIADTENHCIRHLDLKTGIIVTVAGTGERGDGPEGDPLRCRLARPHGIDVDRAGNVYFADTENHKIRMIHEILPPTPAPGRGLPQQHRPAAPPQTFLDRHKTTAFHLTPRN